MCVNSSFAIRVWTRFYGAVTAFLAFISGRRYREIPRVSGDPISGRLLSFFQEGGALRTMMLAGRLALTNSMGMSYYWLLHQTVLVVTRPVDIKHFLTKKEYKRTGLVFTKDIFGRNILAVDGITWRHKLQVYRRYFTRGEDLLHYEKNTEKLMSELLDEMVKSNSERVSSTQLIKAFAVANVAINFLTNQTLSHEKLSALRQYVIKITTKVIMTEDDRCLPIKSMIKLIFCKQHYFDAQKLKLRDELASILFGCEGWQGKESRFLDDIFAIANEIDDVFGEATILFTAGSETTTALLTNLLHCLGKHPDVLQRMMREVRERQAMANGEQQNYPYMEAVIKECLRLYPPIPFVAREVVAPTSLSGIALKPGDTVIAGTFFLHRRSELYERPDEFLPARFLAKTSVRYQHKEGTFLPFGYGSMKCIGQQFAMQSVRVFLRCLLSCANVVGLCNGSDSEFVLDRQGTLRISDESWISCQY